ALWFHDAIYDIGRHDNEQRSADWAHAALLAAGVEPASAQRVHALIMVTRHDCAPDSRDAAVLLDIDLAILGQPPHVFARYELQIADEFAAVPLAQRTLRRSAILKHFLDRPRIYHTELFHSLYEVQAHANLAASITALRDGA
ncbi:MAG: N-methyl-D-aspartate receptor NMDAR2C subunit, partial [Burkholderiaceae bacterium]